MTRRFQSACGGAVMANPLAPARRYGISDFEDALDGLRGFSDLLNLASDSTEAPDALRLYQLLNPLLRKMERVFEDMKQHRELRPAFSASGKEIGHG